MLNFFSYIYTYVLFTHSILLECTSDIFHGEHSLGHLELSVFLAESEQGITSDSRKDKTAIEGRSNQFEFCNNINN